MPPPAGVGDTMPLRRLCDRLQDDESWSRIYVVGDVSESLMFDSDTVPQGNSTVRQSRSTSRGQSAPDSDKSEKPSLSVGSTTGVPSKSLRSRSLSRRNQASPWALRRGAGVVRSRATSGRRNQASPWALRLPEETGAEPANDAGETKPLRGLHDVLVDPVLFLETRNRGRRNQASPWASRRQAQRPER